MSEAEVKQGGSPSAQYERCVCREVIDNLQKAFGVPPEVRDHFNNSRIEFLKGIRAIIDSRIEHLSKPSTHGTKIAVE
ncbi:MAG TPA: hypothetical protein VMU53_09495 [Candidatus Sulfotelmatobacter sp.]|jgi:hypothetical protein|nr:hypothetical protein [Candidatus Sulfotelmatobacter sp.]